MGTRAEILNLLADGRFHSGTELGARLDISRAAVCKHIAALGTTGIEVHRVSGRGYRLVAPVAPLDRVRIVEQLAARGIELRDRLEILESVDSTNRHLLARVSDLPSGAVCLAEAQPAGRGRRGRAWIATPYGNLMLSLAWRFPAGPAVIGGLSLAAGLAVARALEDYGVPEVGLKWPNDVMWRDRKLAGLLADVAGEAAGPTIVVLGVGVNARIDARDGARIDQPWVDIQTITGQSVDRNRLAALVIAYLHETCRAYSDYGFAHFRAEWERRHVYHGRAARLIDGEREWHGVVEGVDGNGALLFREHTGARRTVYSGEISLRGES